ncbi:MULTISPECIES: SpoIID/LytB domain-containing protein [Prochlorococcus]|uniref:Putative amidase enhancer n=1 Tax=Prochlorococcus marinus str. MIT 9116 TaxID=167544 RepID=A0A0A1ZVU2_PROMR|nr:SpoIID/LytB domain-containing protein [Prochlorococcus marinus]KGF92148.1 putative amidase enhancer [Prochlorococcus marinus str. MIT 9107]KGF92278.1 putative amidase enhancer [Prochlorococcus marinus str. MIT 9116]KGF94357.1 putative amidase enhancer [Prochlorococcus marinus str. MIT 9123]
MKLKFTFLNLFLSFIFLLINTKVAYNVISEELIKVELNKEIKKGKFLIGLKQYLGSENDSFSIKKNINFKTDKGFLNLHSSNGIKHNSKQINITWRDIPIKNPKTIERIVFGPFASYESAKKQAEKLKDKGFKTTVAYPENWEVWIPFEDDLPEFELKNKIFRKIKNIQITPFLNSEYGFKKLEGPIHIYADEDIKINDVYFGQNFYLIQDSYGTWTLIQKIKFDDYLEGVLPYEIGPSSPLEALKAQAVIARTWGIYNSERFNMDKYHLCISTQCQVYKPPKTKYKKVQKAIEATSNLILTYENQPINAFYHGSNGGVSATSGESWQMQNYSYFNSIIDGSKSLKKIFKLPIPSEFELNHFLDFDKAQFYGSNHSLFRWNKKISSLMIKENLIKNKLINSNQNVLDLNVIERGSSGRVTKLQIKTNKVNQSIVLVKDDIRRVLSFIPSNLFTINKLSDDLWLLKGGGFGHGVGLSQAGAIEMAELGFSYEQILNHYYQDAKLEKIEILSQ